MSPFAALDLHCRRVEINGDVNDKRLGTRLNVEKPIGSAPTGRRSVNLMVISLPRTGI